MNFSMRDIYKFYDLTCEFSESYHQAGEQERGSAQSALLFIPVVLTKRNVEGGGGVWEVSLRPGCTPFFNPTLTTRHPPPRNSTAAGGAGEAWSRCPLTAWAEALHLNVPTSTDLSRPTRATRASRRGGEKRPMSVYPSCHLVRTICKIYQRWYQRWSDETSRLNSKTIF